MGMLDKVALLKKQKLKIEKVTLGDGDFVYVREMTGIEKDAFEMALISPIRNSDGTITGYNRSLDNFRAKLAAATLCDEAGNLLLGMDDATTLGKSMGAKRLDKIIAKASEVNRISQEDRELLVKNSESGQGEDSPSSSAKN